MGWGEFAVLPSNFFAGGAASKGPVNIRGADELPGGVRDKCFTRTIIPTPWPAMFIKSLLTLAIMLAAALPARAQGGFFAEPPEKLFGEALQAPYGQALAKRFAAAVRKAGDPACLQEKALDDAALAARGQALWQRYGLQMTKLIEENFNRAAYQRALTERAGRNAVAEIERLERDRGVKTYKELNRPAQLAKTADMLLEQFDRYVLIGRIKLDPIGPVARGEPELPENPTQAAEAAVEKFLKQHPRVNRYVDLLDTVQAAKDKGIDRPAAAKLGPSGLFCRRRPRPRRTVHRPSLDLFSKSRR